MHIKHLVAVAMALSVAAWMSDESWAQEGQSRPRPLAVSPDPMEVRGFSAESVARTNAFTDACQEAGGTVVPRAEPQRSVTVLTCNGGRVPAAGRGGGGGAEARKAVEALKPEERCEELRRIIVGRWVKGAQEEVVTRTYLALSCPADHLADDLLRASRQAVELPAPAGGRP